MSRAHSTVYSATQTQIMTMCSSFKHRLPRMPVVFDAHFCWRLDANSGVEGSSNLGTICLLMHNNNTANFFEELNWAMFVSVCQYTRMPTPQTGNHASCRLSVQRCTIPRLLIPQTGHFWYLQLPCTVQLHGTYSAETLIVCCPRAYAHSTCTWGSAPCVKP
jgi:hypothetical protein